MRHSCIAAVLSTHFRASSLVEVEAQGELYLAVFRVTRLLASSRPHLLPLLRVQVGKTADATLVAAVRDLCGRYAQLHKSLGLANAATARTPTAAATALLKEAPQLAGAYQQLMLNLSPALAKSPNASPSGVAEDGADANEMQTRLVRRATALLAFVEAELAMLAFDEAEEAAAAAASASTAQRALAESKIAAVQQSSKLEAVNEEAVSLNEEATYVRRFEDLRYDVVDDFVGHHFTSTAFASGIACVIHFVMHWRQRIVSNLLIKMCSFFFM